MNPNMAASASALAATGGYTRWLAKETRAGISSDSVRMEVVIPLPTKRPRTHVRAHCAGCVAAYDRGDAIRTCRPVHAETDGAWQTATKQDNSDDSKIEIIVDEPREPRRVPRSSPNHSRLPGHSLDISPAVPPSTIARQPHPPYTRWIDWRAGNVFGGAGASTDTGEYAGDGTVGPSVIAGGGNNSPGKLVDDVSSPVRGFGGMLPPRATDEDYEEEEDIMGMLLENTSEDNFVPPSGLGKAKGRAVVSPESVAAAAGSRVRTKSWRKTLADEVEVRHDDDESSNDDGPRAHAIFSPVFTNARRKKRTLASSSRACSRGGGGRRRTSNAATCFAISCIEKWYPELTFDRTPEEFECPGSLQLFWSARQGGSHLASSQVPAAKQPTTTTTTDAQVFDASWSATVMFTVSGEPPGSAFLHGNKARIVPVSHPTASPTAATTTPTAPATITCQPDTRTRRTAAAIAKTPACVYQETAQDVGAAHVPFGSRARSAGAAEIDEGEGEIDGHGAPGSLEALLVAPRRWRRRLRSESLTPLNDDDDGDEDGDIDEGDDVNADADADADDGIWPGEYVVPVPPAQVEDTASLRITPEVERAIGAAFAIDAVSSSSSSGGKKKNELVLLRFEIPYIALLFVRTMQRNRVTFLARRDNKASTPDPHRRAPGGTHGCDLTP
ncbi:hypothetical protein EDB85DRAFT_2272139 [Lactarius pseudohatsudake]|nr:hypothetical protein EDB85DRAFT_2272139 [Lactarius pseudohatsudake]